MRPIILHYGNITVAVKEEKGKLYIGTSKCSTKDQYNRKLGNRIAIGRLEKNIKKDSQLVPLYIKDEDLNAIKKDYQNIMSKLGRKS